MLLKAVKGGAYLKIIELQEGAGVKRVEESELKLQYKFSIFVSYKRRGMKTKPCYTG